MRLKIVRSKNRACGCEPGFTHHDNAIFLSDFGNYFSFSILRVTTAPNSYLNAAIPNYMNPAPVHPGYPMMAGGHAAVNPAMRNMYGMPGAPAGGGGGGVNHNNGGNYGKKTSSSAGALAGVLVFVVILGCCIKR